MIAEYVKRRHHVKLFLISLKELIYVLTVMDVMSVLKFARKMPFQ